MDKNFSLDLDILPKELILIFEIIKADSDDCIQLKKPNLFSDIDWEYFLKLARHHRVYPFIYSKLKMVGEEWIPSHVIQTLYQEYKKNTFQMLLLSGEMEKISELFIENQIRLLFLKGPVIAADIYGDISLRTSKDLDILIPITDVEKAEKLLLNFGYERELGEFVLNQRKWKSRHVTYTHPQKGIELEIHWRLNPYPSKEPTFNELWQKKRVSTFTYPVYFLGKEDLFLFLVSHGARHGWFRLRWLLDIDQMLRKGLDQEKAKIFLKRNQVLHLGGQALILASQLLNTPINGEFQRLTLGNRSKKLAHYAMLFIKEMVPLDIISSTNDYRRYLFSLKSSNLQKIIHFLLLMYPSSMDVMTLRLPKHLHFLYFPLRPFLWSWRKVMKSVKP